MNLLQDRGLINRNVQELLLYCLGELCDGRMQVEKPLSAKTCKEAKRAIESFWNRVEFEDKSEMLERRVATALKMIAGEELTIEENAELLAVRNKF